MKNKVIALPSDGVKIQAIYKNALKRASEIYILSAYLTNWDYSNVSINKNCNKFLFIIGTNFGLTRKEACKKVLRWLPSNLKTSFYYNELSGFHPKILLYKLNQKSHLLVGSSNLSYGGLSSNYEVNYHTELTTVEYQYIIKWIYEIHSRSNSVNEHWINNYNEGIISQKNNKDLFRQSQEKFSLFTLSIGKKEFEKLAFRKKQVSKFNRISSDFRELILKCAKKKISNIDFYEIHFKLRRDSLFQDIQWVIKCKHSKWNLICNSLIKIFTEYENYIKSPNKQIHLLDSVVKNELEYLKKIKHPARNAWFSEVLCQFFPKYYPLINNPIKKWLNTNKIGSPSRSSESSKYLDITVKLRRLLENNEKIKNFAELDAVAWNIKNTHYE